VAVKTSGFSRANIEMVPAQLGGEGLKHHDMAYLIRNYFLHYLTNSEKVSRTGFKNIESLQIP
jgi:hypothetical protein